MRRIFLVKVNVTKLNFSGQTEDQRVKGAVRNVDQTVLVHQNSHSIFRQHIIEIPLMKRGRKKCSFLPHPPFPFTAESLSQYSNIEYTSVQ